MPNKNPASSGYLTIKQSAIGKMYIQKLDNLKFTGADINDVGGENSCTVPLPERDCKTYEQIETKKPACRCFSWSSVGLCAGGYDTQCPSLAGTNIDSFKIYPARAYVVLFVYFDPLDTSIGPWTFCQEFPTKDDINKTGPINIKWEPVLNRISTERQKMMVPNYVIIFPVKP
jgi:hypothetical protein